MDCLVGQDFVTFDFNQTPNYEICKRLCNDYNNCTAFIVYEHSCFFKDGDCQNNLYGKSGETTFIPQGEAKE